MKHFLQCLFSLMCVASLSGQPTNNAAEPPARNATDIISIYGGTYTNISNVNYNPFWGQSGSVNTDFDPGSGNLVLAYTNFNYQGTGFEANPQNASAMEYIHIDIWTSNATNVKFSPIDNSGVGVGEFLVEVPLVSGQWSSVDLPKSAFQGMSWNSVFQLKFDGQGGTNPSDIYLDNIYFWKSPTTAGSDASLSVLEVNGANLPGFTPSALEYSFGVPGGAPVPTITLATPTDSLATITALSQATAIPGTATVEVTAANGINKSTYSIFFYYNSPSEAAPEPKYADVISLFCDTYNSVNVDTWNTSWSQATFESIVIEGNTTYKYTNVGFNGIETTTHPINAETMQYLHLDVWTPNVNPLNIKLVSFLGDGYQGNNGDSEANLNVELIPYEWNQIKIPLSDFTNAGLKSLDDLNQYIFTSTPFGSGTLYIDNVFFSTGVSATRDVVSQDVNVFPNPATNHQTISVDGANITAITLISPAGTQIASSSNNQLSIQGVQHGMYLLKIVDKDNHTIVKKVIIQ